MGERHPEIGCWQTAGNPTWTSPRAKHAFRDVDETRKSGPCEGGQQPGAAAPGCANQSDRPCVGEVPRSKEPLLEAVFMHADWPGPFREACVLPLRAGSNIDQGDVAICQCGSRLRRRPDRPGRSRRQSRGEGQSR
ncbi:hypothetical protein TM5383_03336 [Thalassovita mediterranea]|uniref:Uncharacterized protein n=1 Tax=Thalassovita mediterranea TaxID=340021 RepID=A0A0P1GTD7_9RHOB|nr:hypothetical protein TM5383_03336 [Thalassovita mediterranea]SIS34655.1 hypothetical protein SAMN05421685_11256 [Thalassovita mediterranea]